MENKIAKTILLNSIFITFVIAQKQQYPNLRDIQIRADISYSKDEQLYYYAYSMTNNPSNIGSIAKIEIDISRKSGTSEIDTIGLRFENDGFTENSFRRHFQSLKGRIVPVGFLKTPGISWLGGLTNRCTASFSADSVFIDPGERLDGYEMVSKGIPGIRRCIVSPYFDVIALFPDPEDTTISYYVPPLDSVRNAIKYYGWTIGPTAPPMDFSSTVWCDELINYTSQSRILGWIKNQSTTDKYIGCFSTVKTQLQMNNAIDARVTLQEVLIDVNADSTNNLTSEAYALIRYNTEYLMMQLFIPPNK